MKFETSEGQEHEAAKERGARGVEAMRQRKREVQKPGSRAGKGYFDHKGRWNYGERPGKERTTRTAEKQLGLGRMKPAVDEKPGAASRWAPPEGVGTVAAYPEKMEDKRIREGVAEHPFVPVGGQTGCKQCGYAKGHHPKRGVPEVMKGLVNEGQPPADSMKSAPPGWGGTVEHMKEHKDISNPFALAWHMKKKGMKPHYAETRKAGIPGCSTCLKAAFDAGMMKGGAVLVDDLYYRSAAGRIFHLP